MQTTWERETDKKIQKNTVKRRINDLLQREQLSLEERRDKLVLIPLAIPPPCSRAVSQSRTSVPRKLQCGGNECS